MLAGVAGELDGGTVITVVGVRVLISGMGGELGTRVATLLERESWVGAISGIDIDPPRGRLRRSEFHRFEPGDRRRTVRIVREFEPEVVLHLGVYEPHARSTPAAAAARNQSVAVSVLGAATDCRSLQAVVVRSGIEVYGRRRGSPVRPDESVAPDPTTAFGHQLLGVEQIATDAARAAEVPLTLLRLAPVLGAHIPSPLGRLLRLPVMPVNMLADPAFTLLHVDDAARAVLVAARAQVNGPLNIVSSGAVTTVQAARLGGRLPMPVVGPQWKVAALLTNLLGAPLPDHVLELVRRGRVADGALALEVLGFSPSRSTIDVVRRIFEWETIEHRRPSEAVAA